MAKLTKNSCRSLFDSFEEEMNNGESTSDFLNNRETMNIKDGNSSIDENTNLNEHYDYKAMVKYFLKIKT